jgi:hypothetical protein
MALIIPKSVGGTGEDVTPDQPVEPIERRASNLVIPESVGGPKTGVAVETRERVGGRRGAAQRRRERVTEAEQLLSRIEAGEISAQDLPESQFESVEKLRFERIPEISEAGISGLTGAEGLEGLPPALATLTTFDPVEFGQILKTQFPQIGIATTPEGRQIAVNNETGAAVEINKPGLTGIDVLQGLGVVAAFTPAARGAVAAPSAVGALIGREVAAPTGVRVLAGGAGAAATEAGIQKVQEATGGEFDPEDVALAGSLGAAGEVAQPIVQAVGRGAARVVRGAEETAEQAARRELLQAEGLEPTRPQITREATEFQQQQELAKASGPVRARLEQQEARLQGAFEQRATDTQGNIITSTSTPIDEVLNRSIDLDQQISNLYKQARSVSPGEKDIRLEGLSQRLRQMAGEERASGGLISSVRSNLRQRGIIDGKGKVVGRISVDVAEQVRKDINALHDSLTDRGRQLSRLLKDRLDNDVFKARGEDIFERARSAKSDFEKGLSRAKISKFDKRQANLVRDMLENKVSPDDFVNDVVFSKKWRPEDINQLKLYLNQTDSGSQAWNDLRAQTVDEMRVRAFTGPLRADGETKSLSRAGLEKALDKLSGKVNVLFNKEERDFFNRMKEIARLREPPPATFAGKGPSAQAINQAKTRFPILGPIIDSLSEFRQSKLLLKLPRKRVRRGTRLRVPPQTIQAIRVEE